ncbi:MAG: chemotaxis protein CheD [Alphaproteobacteria bacterium]|nr:chemotaxis protein CheD [Alphaproteobacteria bacterium]MBU1525207.1 chemotaxis protein CheD [Alphaproteobacteria bacterium]MBU2117764.1 chemotaxis protein CheD [Alphaproteobacteria bacterium]MBU2352203.1 chemotaxis protein CheD [Alphaproteobacteria bacterium]MBU2381213.1 chemotaxis protein CheD [Alphaproteobacteria bacterium]
MAEGDPGMRRIHVVQGSHAVSGDADVCLTTILGSCVSACVWDPQAHLGGMNHFLLPEAPDGAPADRRYGVQAMELLINALLARGARRDRLRAKVFGGGRMSESMADIGGRNAEFVRRFLRDEEIPVEAESLGGSAARRIQFWPTTGRVRQHMVDPGGVARDERHAAPVPAPAGGELELF